MEDMELILQALQKLNGRLDSMDTKLEQMDDKLEQLIEDHSITCDGVNALLEWADECGRVVKFPLPNVK